MTKEQLNVRISQATRDKLDHLTERHGTQTETVAVAIDRLYQAEKENVMHIKIEYSEDSLFNGWNTEGIDIATSVTRYGELLDDVIHQYYPDAEVTVEESMHNHIRVDGRTDTDDAIDVDSIARDVYEEMRWLVCETYEDAFKYGLTMEATIHGGSTTVYASTVDGPHLSYVKESLPPHASETFDDVDALISRMHDIADDWEVTGR